MSEGPLSKNDEGPPTHVGGPQRHEQGGSGGGASSSSLVGDPQGGLAVSETPFADEPAEAKRSRARRGGVGGPNGAL